MRNPTTADIEIKARSFFSLIRLGAGGQRQRSYETTLKTNRRISNIEPQNVEVWNRFAQSF